MDISGTSKGGSASILKPHLQFLARRLIGLRGFCGYFQRFSRVDIRRDRFCAVVNAMVPFFNKLSLRSDRSFVFDNRLKASLVQPELLDIIRYPCKYGKDGKNIPHEKKLQ
jgi:hypothetical protein